MDIISGENAKRREEFINFREVLTKLHEATSAPLPEIAEWISANKIHTNEKASAYWRNGWIHADHGERHGSLLTATIATNAIPERCGLGYENDWGPDNVGWRRAELKELLRSHSVMAQYADRLSPSPGFEPRPPRPPAADETPRGRWPWGDHETELLRHLAKAAEKFWKNYDPFEPDTAPKNVDVSRWLQEQGVKQRNAEIMATLLRANGLKTGPRSK